MKIYRPTTVSNIFIYLIALLISSALFHFILTAFNEYCFCRLLVWRIRYLTVFSDMFSLLYKLVVVVSGFLQDV